jgi:hypothetical protein
MHKINLDNLSLKLVLCSHFFTIFDFLIMHVFKVRSFEFSNNLYFIHKQQTNLVEKSFKCHLYVFL